MKIGDLVIIRNYAGLQEQFLGKSGIIIGNNPAGASNYGRRHAWQVLVEETILPLVFTDELELLILE